MWVRIPLHPPILKGLILKKQIVISEAEIKGMIADAVELSEGIDVSTEDVELEFSSDLGEYVVIIPILDNVVTTISFEESKPDLELHWESTGEYRD